MPGYTIVTCLRSLVCTGSRKAASRVIFTLESLSASGEIE